MATNINNLAAEINRQLALYANQTEESVQKIAEKVANDGVEMLKVQSPKDTGDHAENWTVKKVKRKFIIHNKARRNITHLLEKGHAKVGGGRVNPQVHIKPVETKMIDEFEDELRRGLSQ